MNRDNIKQRLEVAGAALALLPMPRNGIPQGNRAAWPQIVRSPVEFYAAQVMADREHREELLAGRNSVRIRAEQKQIEILDQMLELLIQISDPRKRAILLARNLKHPHSTRRPSYRKLGKHFGISHEYVRMLYNEGVEDLRRLANST